MKNALKSIIILALSLSVMTTAYAAEIPIESYPENATEESIAITENLISGVLDEVKNGLGFQPAWCRANNAIFNAVLADDTNGYGYANLANIARNAIFQYRDMYLRPDYYAEAENKVNALIADIVAEVENGKDYDTALKESYIRIYQSINPAFNADETFSVDSCYRDMPAVDSVMFTQARKLLINARSRAGLNTQK